MAITEEEKERRAKERKKIIESKKIPLEKRCPELWDEREIKNTAIFYAKARLQCRYFSVCKGWVNNTCDVGSCIHFNDDFTITGSIYNKENGYVIVFFNQLTDCDEYEDFFITIHIGVNIIKYCNVYRVMNRNGEAVIDRRGVTPYNGEEITPIFGMNECSISEY